MAPEGSRQSPRHDPSALARSPASPDRRRTVAGVCALLIAVAAFAYAAVRLLDASDGLGGTQAVAGRQLQSILEDDRLFLYPPLTSAGDGSVAAAVQVAKGLGVTRLRLLIEWQYVAPHVRPAHFDGADPADYPLCAWAPYDRILHDANAAGIGVDFDLSGPAPTWAAGRSPAGVTPGVANPNAGEFEQFVRAAGTRYEGGYTPPADCPGENYTGGGTVPRVAFWSVWNEPNQKGWLYPQYVAPGRDGTSGRDRTASGQAGTSGQASSDTATSPRLYRGLVRAFWNGLAASGHRPGRDTILVGELAPEGCIPGVRCRGYASPASYPIPPVPFIRDLYCLSGSGEPLRGAAATAQGCDPTGDRAAFVRRNPALFAMTGFSHHPYDFSAAPGVPLPEPEFVSLADLHRLERLLDVATAAYGVDRQLPVYLTEYGYVTDPPNPFYATTLAEQARYLDEAAYLAFLDPRVRALGQYLLVDTPPDSQYPVGSRPYWSGFQEGLVFTDLRPKPAFAAYRLPIWLPHPTVTAGGSVLVWGMLRSAPAGARETVQIRWQPPGGGSRTLQEVRVHSPSGFFEARVRPPGSGTLRLSWPQRRGPAILSRAAAVTVTG